MPAADVATALRFPLAVLFPLVRTPVWQLAIVAAAAATDVADGLLARRFGGSRVGAVLDPIADKVFMAGALVTIPLRGLLQWDEVLGVLLRGLVAALGVFAAGILWRPLRLAAPPRGEAGGASARF